MLGERLFRKVARALGLVLLLAALVAPAGDAASAHSAARVDLLKAVRGQLPKVKRATTVPILLPRYVELAGARAPKVYASGGGWRAGWALSLAFVPNCGGANACFLASFGGDRGKKLPGRAKVQLAGGVRARYQPVSCGASCSPASLWFVYRRVLYSWQVKDLPRNGRAVLVRMANEALRAGPR